MKKSNFPYLFWLPLLSCLIGLACSPKADSMPETQLLSLDSDDCYFPDLTEMLTCCSDRKVKDSCAYKWLHQWTDTYQGAQGFGKTYSPGGIVMPNLAVQRLLSLCPTCTGVRAYFGFEFKDGDSLLSLMLVNVDSNCNDVYVPSDTEQDGGILYQSSREAEPRLIPRDSASLHAHAWDNLFSSTAPNTPFSGFTAVRAYNYKRSMLNDLVSVGKYTTAFQLAVHEVRQSNPYYAFSETITITRVHDILLQQHNLKGGPEGAYIDFAMPCPNFCGDKNLYSDH